MSQSKEDTTTALRLQKEAEQTSLSIKSITEGSTERGLPKVKFIDDIDIFSNSFDPPASVELMIGAFSDLFGSMKSLESTLDMRGEPHPTGAKRLFQSFRNKSIEWISTQNVWN